MQPTESPPPQEKLDPLIETLIDRMVPFDREESERRANELKNQDRLTVGGSFNYLASNARLAHEEFRYDHIRKTVDGDVDNFRLKCTEDAWTTVGPGRVEIVGAILIRSSLPRVSRRGMTDAQIIEAENKIVLVSFGDPDPEHGLIVRPGGFQFAEIQPGTVVMIRSRAGAGPLSAGISLIPG